MDKNVLSAIPDWFHRCHTAYNVVTYLLLSVFAIVARGALVISLSFFVYLLNFLSNSGHLKQTNQMRCLGIILCT